MLRNKEVIRVLLLMVIISIMIILITGLLYSIGPALIVTALATLLIAISLLSTKWRYKEIEKLSQYLRQINSGNYSLDVRDNREGELSILKNDIYKVTLMLSEQSSHLQEDKIHLTDAISDISHQLKTPLTSMMVMADLLSDSNLNESKRKEFTYKLNVQLERIEWLVTSLLKLSKIDAGTAIFKDDAISVSKLIKKAVDPILIPMDIKGQTLNIKGAETVSFQGDLNWTAEALLNLLKNCVEHTPEGGRITISFSENALFTSLTIEDNGQGIAKNDLPHIFKRFYKGENGSEDSVGIGLAMAYSIITKQHGDIQVKSKPGEGTQFIIKFYKQII